MPVARMVATAPGEGGVGGSQVVELTECWVIHHQDDVLIVQGPVSNGDQHASKRCKRMVARADEEERTMTRVRPPGRLSTGWVVAHVYQQARLSTDVYQQARLSTDVSQQAGWSRTQRIPWFLGVRCLSLQWRPPYPLMQRL